MGSVGKDDQLDRIEQQLAKLNETGWTVDQLVKQMGELTKRVWALEQRSSLKPQPSPPTESPFHPIQEKVISPEVIPKQEAPVVHEPTPSFKKVPLYEESPHKVQQRSDFQIPAEPVHKKRTGMEWETLVGGKWALWVGSIAVFLAIAFFLAYTWDKISPVGRITRGYISGLLFLAGGFYSKKKMDRWFYQGLLGAGLAISYLTTWSGTAFYHLISPEAAFAVMGAITALGVVLAVVNDALSLITLSTLGGFLTPILLQSGGHTVGLLNYISLLNLGILAVSLFKRWRAVTWLSFAATVLLVAGRASESWIESERILYFGFSSFYFLLFLASSCFYSLIHKEETRPEDLSLFFVNAFVYALAGYSLIHPLLGNSPGVFPFGLFLLFVLFALIVNALAPQNQVLKLSAIGLSTFFFTIGIPVQFHQQWITVAWSVEAAVLCTLGIRFQNNVYRKSAAMVWVISLVSLVSDLFSIEPKLRILFVNERALPLLVSFLATSWMALWEHFKGEKTEGLPSYYGGLAVLAGAWLLGQETYLGFEWKQFLWPQTWQASSIFVIGSILAVYSATVFASGIKLRFPAIRISALSVAIAAAALPVIASQMLGHTDWTPFLNLRWLSYVVAGLSLGAIRWMTLKEKDLLDDSEGSLGIRALVIMFLVILWGITIEIYSSFEWLRIPSPETWTLAAFFAISILWAYYGTVLLLIAIRRGRPELRSLGILIGLIAIAILACDALSMSSSVWSPVFNLRFIAFAAVAVALSINARLIRQSEEVASLSNIAVMGAVILGLWGLTQETYETFYHYRAAFGGNWDRAAQMGISLVWTLCGTLLLIGGILRRHQPVRLFSLTLFGLTILKVFFFDLSFLDTPYRILSFGGLGGALIGISWLYSRYGKGMDSSS